MVSLERVLSSKLQTLRRKMHLVTGASSQHPPGQNMCQIIATILVLSGVCSSVAVALAQHADFLGSRDAAHYAWITSSAPDRRPVEPGNSAQQEQNTQTAKQTESVIVSKGFSAEAYSQLGIALYRQGKPTDSLNAFSSMLKFRQPNADELRIVGLDYVALHDLPSADRWLHASLSLKSDDWRTWRYLGGVLYSEEKAADAATSFHECLKLDPRNALAEDGLARALDALGHHDEAGQSYQLAVEFNRENHPPSPLPPLHYGIFLFKRGILKDALEQLNFAEVLDPKDSETHEIVGSLYRRLGDREKAIAETSIAATLCPERARLHFVLAQLYRDAGKNAERQKEIEQYVVLSKNNPDDPDR
jgi:tetratricopeptide (TPR) repeat protein